MRLLTRLYGISCNHAGLGASLNAKQNYSYNMNICVQVNRQKPVIYWQSFYHVSLEAVLS